MELDLEGEGLAGFWGVGEDIPCEGKEMHFPLSRNTLSSFLFLEYLQIKRCSFKKSANSYLAFKNAAYLTEAAK